MSFNKKRTRDVWRIGGKCLLLQKITYTSSEKTIAVIMEPVIFISYTWKDEAIALKVQNFMESKGYCVKIDRDALHFMDSIKQFMDTIQEAPFVVPIISDQYLRRENCMYEVSKLVEDSRFIDRLLPIILDDAKIFGNQDPLNYHRFWSEKYDEAERALSEHCYTTEVKKTILQHMEDIKAIQRALVKFLQIRDNLLIHFPELEAQEYQPFIERICRQYKSSPINGNNEEKRLLKSFTVGERLFGTVKMVRNDAFLIQVHSQSGWRDGLLLKDSLERAGYLFKQVKKFLEIGDGVHVAIAEIQPKSLAVAKGGGLIFSVTDEFQNLLYNKIANYIEDAKNQNLEELDLSGLGLSKLPPAITELKSLRKINISLNRFEDIPLEFDLLPNLETVSCNIISKRVHRFNCLHY